MTTVLPQPLRTQSDPDPAPPGSLSGGALVEHALPLAPCQRDVWQDHRAYPGQAHLTIGGCAFLHGPMNFDLLRRAVQALRAECPSLRTAVAPDRQEQMVLASDSPGDVRYFDFSDYPDPVAAIRTRWQDQANRPIPLSANRAPWFIELTKASESLYGLMPLFHHSIMDGYGTSVMVCRLAEHYTHLALGTPLPPLQDAGYESFVKQELDHRKTAYWQRSLDSWLATFQTLPAGLFSALPSSDPADVLPTPEQRRALLPPAYLDSLPVTRSLFERVQSHSKTLGCTPFHLCLAAVALAASAQGGQDDLVIAVPTLNRPGKRYRQTAALFASLLPLRLQIDRRDTLAALMAQIGQGLRTAYRHRRVSLTEISRALDLFSQGRDRLFDVVFSFEDLSYRCTYGGADLIGPRQLFSGTARYPLGVTLCDFADDQDLELTVEANSAMIPSAIAESLNRRIVHILETLCDRRQARAETLLSDLCLCPPAERETLLAWGEDRKEAATSAGRSPKQAPPSVVEAFYAVAQADPGRKAIEQQGFPSWTYRDLRARCDELAQALAAQTLGQQTLPEQTAPTRPVVALHLPPGPDLLAAMLAVMAVGGTFVPLDCEAPLAYRLERLADSGVSIVLGLSKDHDMAHALAQMPEQGAPLGDSPQSPQLGIRTACSFLAVDRLAKVFAAPPAEAWAADPPADTPGHDQGDPDQAAYLLYTSGSSGRPKGVAVSHRALALRLFHLAQLWRITPNDCAGAIARPTFDPSLITLLMPLMVGATVALPRQWRMDGAALTAFVLRHKVSFSALVPTTVALLRDGLAAADQPHHLRVVCCGGETLSPHLALSFQQATGAKIDNLYGPTEATIYATRWPCDTLMTSAMGSNERDGDTLPSAPGPLPRVLPIGRPTNGTVVRLLGTDNDLAALGAEGEIALGGDGLALGYAGQSSQQPQSTDRFVTLDCGRGPERLYRTGDRGRWSPQGALLFCGRMDRQIKLNGQRIEPAEVEAALCQDPDVLAAVVDARPAGQHESGNPGENTPQRLYGWVHSRTNAPAPLATRLLDRVAATLPMHLTLAGLSVLADPPLTPSGKIDCAALATPGIGGGTGPLSGAERNSGEPTTPLERELARLWAEALRLEQSLGLRDDLFALGGDSLAAMTVLTGLEKMVGPGLPLTLLLRHPTIAAQVQALGEALSHRAICLAEQPQASDGGHPIIFIAASGHGDALRFRHLADALAPSCEIHMLQPPLDPGTEGHGASIPPSATAQQGEAPDFTDLAKTYGDLITSTLANHPSTNGPAAVARMAKQGIAPVFIMGFSLGGVAALETARILQAQGHPAQRLILLDTTYPYASPVGQRVWRRCARAIRTLGLHHRIPLLARWIAMLDDQGLAWQLRALQTYQPAPYDGPTDLLISTGLRPLSAFLFKPWQKVLGRNLKHHSVSGLHGSLLRPPKVDALAKLLGQLTGKTPDC